MLTLTSTVSLVNLYAAADKRLVSIWDFVSLRLLTNSTLSPNNLSSRKLGRIRTFVSSVTLNPRVEHDCKKSGLTLLTTQTAYKVRL
jgi:hypothetical protein